MDRLSFTVQGTDTETLAAAAAAGFLPDAVTVSSDGCIMHMAAYDDGTVEENRRLPYLLVKGTA